MFVTFDLLYNFKISFSLHRFFWIKFIQTNLVIVKLSKTNASLKSAKKCECMVNSLSVDDFLYNERLEFLFTNYFID